MDLNRIMLIGNLTRDPETRHTNSGAQVTKFDIAVNDRSRGRQNETTMFIRVESWGKTAEIVDKYLKKGSSVLVEGRLKIDEYETRDGNKRRDPLVVADRISLGSRPRNDQAGDSGRNYGEDRDSVSNNRDQDSADDRPGYDNDSAASAPGNTEDDLPF